MLSNSTSAASVTLNLEVFALTPGATGTISYTDINGSAVCSSTSGSTCIATYDELDTVTLTASPDQGSVFSSWFTYTSNSSNSGGPCDGNIGPTCSFSASELVGVSYTISADFDLEPSGNPVASDQTLLVAEGATVYSDTLPSVSQALGGETYTLVSGPQEGTVEVTSTGAFTYTNSAGHTTSVNFTWSVSNAQGSSNYTTTLLVDSGSAQNSPPIIDIASDLTVAEDGSISVQGFVSDPELDVVAIDSIEASHGTISNVALVAQSSSNEITFDYSPAPDYFGADAIVVSVSDALGAAGTASIAVDVTGVNDPPVILDQTFSVDQDSVLEGQVEATDVDGDQLVGEVLVPPQHGVLDVDLMTGSFTYTPNAGFVGQDNVDVKVKDPQGSESQATITIVVVNVNDPPVAVNDAAVSTQEGQSVVITDVLANDSDPDGDSLSVSNASAENGVVAVGSSFLGIQNLTYTPNTGFSGEDTVTYTVIDRNGGSDTATIIVTVVDVNDAPLASDDAALTTDEEVSVTSGDLLANDTDPDGDVLVITGATANHGSVVVNSDGSITYEPATDFFGTDVVTYTIGDGRGGEASAAFDVTVVNVNDAPVLPDQSFMVPQDTQLTEQIYAEDADDDQLTGELLTQPQHGTLEVDLLTGVFTYTPDAGFVGVDSVDIKVTDGQGGEDQATVTITVTDTNDVPQISDQNFDLDENGTFSGQVAASDADADSLSYAVVVDVSSGQLTMTSEGSFTYVPAPGFVGLDSFDVEVSDGNGGLAQATVSLRVNNVNDVPVANNDPDQNALEDQVVTISGVLNNDVDADGDTLSVTAGSAVSGSVSVSGNNLIYTPNQNFNGIDTVTYTVSDGNGGTDTAQVKVIVAPVNDPPTAVNDSGYSTPFETAVTLSDVLANDSDIDGDVISITSVNGSGGQALLNADQTITFTPASGFSGQATVTYVVSDTDGLTATGIATLTVLPSNSAPTAVDDTGVVMEAGTTIVLDSILNNDSDADGDAISIVSATTTVGAVSVSSSTSLSVSIPIDTTATVVQVTYTIQDTEGQTAEATVTIEVIPDNFAPIANDDEAVTIYEGEVTPAQNVLANDTDADGDILSVVSASAASGTVTINPDDTLSYVPNTGFTGDDIVTYTIDDGRGARDTASFIVSVLPNVPDAPANQVPSANNDSPLATDFGVALDGIDVLTNDYDPDGDKLTVVQAGANHGVVTINADGTLRYVPNPGFSGADVVKYTISDGNGGRDDATFTVTVAAGGTNTPPRAFDDGPFDILSNETQIEFNVLSNDVDPDGDELELLNASAQDGKVVALPDGLIRYTKPEQFDGKDIITYTISDGQGGVATARAIIQGPATIPNRPPSALDDGPFIIFQGGRAKDIDVLANDNDPDGDFLTITSVSADSGVASISDDNTIDYVAASDYLGLVRITYTISDGQGETATAVLTIEVQAPPQNNTPPSSRSINFEVTTDVTLTSILPAATDAEGDAIRYVLAIAPKDGTVKIEGNGRFSYTPDTSFVGLDTFFFYVTDGQLNSRNYQVTLDIDGDSDGDGYLDSVDQCVNTAPDLRVDSTGCAVEEAEDFDGDGVANELDNCPSTPAGQAVDENGCSTEQVEEVVEDFRDLTDDVEEVAEVEVVNQETKNLASTVNTDCNNSIGQGVTSGQQSNLGSACQSLKSGENSSEQVKKAVEEIDYEEVGTLSDNAIASTSNQTQAVGQRMQVVNTGGGGGTVSVDGLNIRYGKQSIPTVALQQVVNSLLGFAAGEGEPEDSFIDFGKLGIFIQGDLDFGDRESSDTQTGYESDSWNLTIGGDYRFKDNLYGGLAFNFGQTDVQYDNRGDESTIENWGMSVYGGWQITEEWYVDALISYGDSDYSTLRNIQYSLNTGDFSATQRGDTTGTQLSYGVNTGYMYNKNGFRFGPILSFFYSDGTIDGFKERAIKGSDAWAFEVGEQTIQSTRVSAGLQMDYSWSTDWGVLIPGLRATYVREKEGSDDTVVVRLANGANFADGTSRFAIANEKDDEGYYDISVNVSGQFVMGVSGFVSYQFYQDYRGYTREGYSVGIRWDKPF